MFTLNTQCLNCVRKANSVPCSPPVPIRHDLVVVFCDSQDPLAEEIRYGNDDLVTVRFWPLCPSCLTELSELLPLVWITDPIQQAMAKMLLILSREDRALFQLHHDAFTQIQENNKTMTENVRKISNEIDEHDLRIMRLT